MTGAAGSAVAEPQVRGACPHALGGQNHRQRDTQSGPRGGRLLQVDVVKVETRNTIPTAAAAIEIILRVPSGIAYS